MYSRVQWQFPVHLPIRQENDVEQQRPEPLVGELPVGVDEGLAGDAVAKDEDHQQEDEGHDLGDLKKKW